METQRSALLAMGFTLFLLNSYAIGQGVYGRGGNGKGRSPGCGSGLPCKGKSNTCCSGAISDYFQTNQFEKLFSKRNSAVAHALDFWDYNSFITASDEYQPYGFGTTDGEYFLGLKEVAAFLAHVGSKTSCGYEAATGGEPLAWGLCYNNKEMNSGSSYCDEHYKHTYPCTPGVAYYGRGALPIYWNYNYGEAGKALKVDLLNHPEYIEQNATLAFQVAIWRWMTPVKEHQPSAHDVFVGSWNPTLQKLGSSAAISLAAT